MATIQLAGCGDTAAEDINGQIFACREARLPFLELRRMNAGTAYRYTSGQMKAVKALVSDGGIRILSLATDLGLCPADTDFNSLRETFYRAAENACMAGARYISCMGFRETADVQCREQAFAHLAAFGEYANAQGLRLLIENHAGTLLCSASDIAELFSSLSPYADLLLDLDAFSDKPEAILPCVTNIRTSKANTALFAVVQQKNGFVSVQTEKIGDCAAFIETAGKMQEVCVCR